MPTLDFAQLKDKHRSVRDQAPPDVRLRVHRALSWMQRAEAAADDLDARFIFYWIAFNAAYADDRAEALRPSERNAFEDYFGKLVRLDRARRIHDAIWSQFTESIRALLENPYVFRPFWLHHNGVPNCDNWQSWFDDSRRKLQTALCSQNTHFVLATLFDRLYVLRNQVMHGGATWNSGVNRDQLRAGVAILAELVPVFVDVMIDHPAQDWGAPHYPVVA